MMFRRRGPACIRRRTLLQVVRQSGGEFTDQQYNLDLRRPKVWKRAMEHPL